jgi:hypothetical protein
MNDNPSKAIQDHRISRRALQLRSDTRLTSPSLELNGRTFYDRCVRSCIRANNLGTPLRLPWSRDGNQI